MAAAPLGECRCPLCGGPARASLSKRDLAVLTCTQPGCGIQLFARSDDADERIRALIVAPQPVRTEAPAAPAPQPAPEPVRTDEPELPPVAHPVSHPAPAGGGVGLLKGWFQ